MIGLYENKNAQMLKYLLSGIMVVMVAIGFGRFAYTPMFPILIRDAGLSLSMGSLIASVNYLGYMIGALTPLFVRGEHIRFRVLSLGTLMVAIGVALMMINVDETLMQTLVWGLGRLVTGIGSGWIFVNVSSLVLEKLAFYQRMDLMGWVNSGVGLGSLVATLIVYALNSEILHVSWQVIWLVILAVGLLFCVPAWLFLDEDEHTVHLVDETAPVINKKNIHFSDVNIQPVWWLALAYACKGFAYIIVMTFLPLITKEMGSVARSSWLILLICAVPSSIVWGWLSHKFGNIRCLQSAYILQAMGVFALVLMPNDYGALLCAVFVGSTFMGIVTMILAQARYVNAEMATMIIALITGMYSIAQMIGPSFAGFIYNYTGNFSVALISASAVLLFGVFALWRIKVTTNKQQA